MYLSGLSLPLWWPVPIEPVVLWPEETKESRAEEVVGANEAEWAAGLQDQS